MGELKKKKSEVINDHFYHVSKAVFIKPSFFMNPALRLILIKKNPSAFHYDFTMVGFSGFVLVELIPEHPLVSLNS